MEHPEERHQIELPAGETPGKSRFQEVVLEENDVLAGGEALSRLGETEGTFVDSAVVERA
jgi:hypothetical protein